MIIEMLVSQLSLELLIAASLGLVIGMERELSGKDPGLRTFTLVAMGSCLFSIISIWSAAGIAGAEPSRIAAQIIPGIGFLGAGAIFRSNVGVAGLTTGALMWVTAAIGMAVGFGRVDLAVSCTFITITMMYGLKLVHQLLDILKPSTAGKPRHNAQ